MPLIYDRTNTATDVPAARHAELLQRPGFTAAAKAGGATVPEKTSRSRGGHSTHVKA